MRKTHTTLLFTLCGLLFYGNGSAQTVVQDGNIAVQMNELAQRGDSLYVKMMVSTAGRNVASRKSAEFTSILSTEEHVKELPSISVMGRNSYKNYRRNRALLSQREHTMYDPYMPYAVVRDYKENQTVEYALTVPYEPWMSSAQLTLRRNDCGCGKVRTTDTRLLANHVDLERVIVIERYNITPHLAYLRPEAEPVKMRSVTSEAFLDFAVGRTDLRPDFGNNASELEKIRAAFAGVGDDDDVTLTGVSLCGYASPEGSVARNRQLSEGRAIALKKYLMTKFDYPESFYTTRFGGEDWEGLAALVENSGMQYKQEVLELIENVSVEQDRETRLMALKGGAPYRWMLKELFPKLRRVTFRADYKVRQFNIEEAKEVAKTRPQNLSLNEMFLVANTYEPGSSEFNDLFETAVRMFPEDATANLNAAIAALERRDYVSADRYLQNVKIRMRIPEYDNALGVLVMMRDADYDRAEQYFEAAAQAGLEAATGNLEELGRMRENLDRIREAEMKAHRQ